MKPVPMQLGLVGGVNLLRDPKTIIPGQLALSKNAWPIVPGILSKRAGFVARQFMINGDATVAFHIISWAMCSPALPFKYVAAIHKGTSGGKSELLLVASSFDREDTSFSNGVSISVRAGSTDERPVRFINYRGTVIAVVPDMEGYYILQSDNSGSYKWILNTFAPDPAIFTESGTPVTQAESVKPSLATQYKQRIVWANFGSGRGNWICFADKATAFAMQPLLGYSLPSRIGTDALSLNGRHVPVGALEGETIVAMREVTLASMGSQIDSFLMLLSERSCVLISGEILQTNDTGATDPNGLYGSYKENRVNYECGCASQGTLLHTPYGWIWAGPDDVWIMNDNTPDRVGTNIRPALQACPIARRSRWAAAYANGLYILQLVTDNSTAYDLTRDENGASAVITTDIHQYWILDLRDGVPQSAEQAKWYGPMVAANEDGTTYVYGPLLTDRNTDGTERVIMPQVFSSWGAPTIMDFLGGNLGNDEVFPAIREGLEWQANTAYAIGDIVRPRVNNATAGRTGTFHIASAITGSGTSGSNDPVWALSGSSGNTADNNVTWTEMHSTALIPGVGIPFLLLDLGRDVGAYQVDIRSRDSLLEDVTHEKLLRRVDVNMAASNQVSIGLTALCNNGVIAKSLGPVTFGGEELRLDVDTATLAETIGGVKAVAKAFRPDETNLIAARHLQLKLQDSTAYVIDSSNDYLLFTFFKDDGVELEVAFRLQIAIPHGAYNTISDVLNAIIIRTRLYTSQIAAALGGAVLLFPFSYSTDPVIRLQFAYTNLGPFGGSIVIAPSFGPTDVDITGNIVTTIGDDTATAYLVRSKRLGAMLGFNTTQSSYDSYGPVTDVGSGETFAFGRDTGTSPIHIDGAQIVKTNNSQRFDVLSMTATVQPKAGIPLTTQGRS